VLNEAEPLHSHAKSSGDDAPDQRLRALAERTGSIAHDLNNMLGTIIGYGALVLEDLPADDPNYDFLAKIVEAGAEAKLLVAELLDNARGETARGRRKSVPRAA
jgi:signal transduction histidine kinase